MDNEYPRFYTECEHIITVQSDITDSAELSSSTQEIIRGHCPNCSENPNAAVEASTEPQSPMQLTSYAKSLSDKAQKMIDSLKARTIEIAKLPEEHGSVNLVPVSPSMTLEEEKVGKENIDARHPALEKLKQAIRTSVNSNAIAGKE